MTSFIIVYLTDTGACRIAYLFPYDRCRVIKCGANNNPFPPRSGSETAGPHPTPQQVNPVNVPTLVCQQTLPTPIKLDRLMHWLQGYPLDLKLYLHNGFINGFDIGFQGKNLSSKPYNLQSAFDYPHIVDKKLCEEIEFGRVAGPFEDPPWESLHLSPLGVCEKKVPGTYRMIHHLSFPAGHSVNDGISEDNSKVRYSSISDAIAIINSLGRGCYMAKTDVQSAFRLLPVRPSQYHLLGFTWKGKYYHDRCLPMGSSSSCKIFEQFSTAIQCAAQHRLGVNNMTHILDDYFIANKTYGHCSTQLQEFLNMCYDIGIPMAQDKTFGPDTTMTFLGYELDSILMQVRLPQDKLDKCTRLISYHLSHDKITLRELQSIIGLLNFACAVIVPGRAFLRRLINLTLGVTKPHYRIRLTKGTKDDMILWLTFLSQFNGKCLFLPSAWTSSDTLHLYTDSSASIGYGAVFGNRWFYGRWNDIWRHQNITFLEYYPIILALDTWCEQLANRRILFHTDNLALVSIINNQTTKEPRILHLLRKMVLTCLKYNILFQALHIPGRYNILADFLSRSKVDQFKLQASHMEEFPHLVPPLPDLPS
jgi:hypothetical protein